MSDPLATQAARTLTGSTGGKNVHPDHTALLIDAKSASVMLSLGTRTIWSLTKCNAIPSHRIGRAVRYCPAELRAWIDDGCPTDPGAAERVRKAARR